MSISALLLAALPTLALHTSVPAGSICSPTHSFVQGSRSVDGQLVEVTFLANAGFLIRSGAVSVIIDGFGARPHKGYEGLSNATKDLMRAGRTPFDGYTVGLVSHTHPDHFRARLAASFLSANKRAFVGASEAVVTAIGKGSKDWKAIKAQTIAFTFEQNELLKTFTPPGVDMTVSLFELPHIGDENREVENLGHIIRFGEFRILHLGDMALDGARLKQLDLPKRGIDLAFIPYWFYLDDEGLRIIDEIIQPRHVVVYHMPVEKRASFIEQLAIDNPSVLSFKEPMERKIFDNRAKDDAGER